MVKIVVYIGGVSFGFLRVKNMIILTCYFAFQFKKHLDLLLS
jgi:hypothetical protein